MSNSARPWQEFKLPTEVRRIPAMLSGEEKQYLAWLTAERFEGWGAVVDLGPWLGGSTAALAEGLKRGGKRAKVQSLDLFRWEPSYMEAAAPENLQDGDDFLPAFMREIGDYAPWVEARRADLGQFEWSSGPIELLFVDAAKTWELTNAILAGFGDHLVPGRSRVILQDFRYHDTHWLPLIFDSRPDLWQEVESVAEGWTVTFTPLKPLHGRVGIHPDYSEAAFPFKSAEQLLRRRMAREEPAARLLLLRTLYRKCLIDGSPAERHQLREELLDHGARPEQLAGMERAE